MRSNDGINQLLQDNRDKILRIASKYGASNVRVFGSVARGEEGPDSDVDFLVELEPGRSLMDHAGLMVELEELLGVRVDIVTENSIKKRLRDRILKEAVPI